MRWTPGGRSEDLEDLRSSSGGPRLTGGLGIGGMLVLGLLSLIFRRDLLSPFLSVGGGGSQTTQSDPKRDAAEEPMVQFVSFVLDDAQKTWQAKFASEGKSYRHAKLVLFRDAVESACGSAESAVGPFYCPGDQKVYMDLGFYDE